MALPIWLTENVGFHPTFSRHGIAQASLALLIWLIENVGFHPTFSRHGIAQASLALLIWLNENVDIKSFKLDTTFQSPPKRISFSAEIEINLARD